MSRVTVYHLTPAPRLPPIEEEGLRTRADLSDRMGPPDELDQVAPGAFAHGKRVSAYVSLDHARAQVAEHGPGLVSFTVDPAKALAARAGTRATAPPAAYWESARPLRDWLGEAAPPDDLEVHVNVPVRSKHLTLHAPLLTEEDLGDYAPLVAAVADSDRLSAKALMHLALVACDGDPDTAEFRAACALAWRDTPDPPRLTAELVEMDPDKIASAALAEFGAAAPAATARLRETLEEVRAWADENGVSHGRGLLARTGHVLEDLPTRVV